MTMHMPPAAPDSPAAGWYADPSGGPGLRYWNGGVWTDATQPAPVAAGHPSGPVVYPAATPGFPAAASPYPGAGLPPGSGPSPRFVNRNRFFLITAAICGVYALIAMFSTFALFGVLPALYTFRSFQAREPLAIAALVVTVATIFFSLNHIYR